MSRDNTMRMIKKVMKEASNPKYNHLYLYLDGLKKPEELAKRKFICQKDPKPERKEHA